MYSVGIFSFLQFGRVPQSVFVTHDFDIFVLLCGLSLSVGSLMLPRD